MKPLQNGISRVKRWATSAVAHDVRRASPSVVDSGRSKRRAIQTEPEDSARDHRRASPAARPTRRARPDPGRSRRRVGPDRARLGRRRTSTGWRSLRSRFLRDRRRGEPSRVPGWPSTGSRQLAPVDFSFANTVDGRKVLFSGWALRRVRGVHARRASRTRPTRRGASSGAATTRPGARARSPGRTARG